MKQSPSVKIIFAAVVMQFFLLTGAGVVIEKSEGGNITLPSFDFSTSLHSVISVFESSDEDSSQLAQVDGSIILNTQFGANENTNGLVTCNRGYHVGDTSSCGPCEFFRTIQRIINFLILVSVLLASIMFTYAGFLYLTSSTNPGNISKAKGIFWNVLFGFVAVLGAWIVINTVLNTLAGRSLADVSAIACQNDGRNSSLLPNPNAGQVVNGGRAGELANQIASLDRQISELNRQLAACNSQSENLADRNICRAEVQNKIDQLQQERNAAARSYDTAVRDELLKANTERVAELGREYALRGCNNVVAGEALYARCTEIRGEIDSLRAEIDKINGEVVNNPTPPANTPPAGLEPSTTYPNSGCSYTGGSCYVDPGYNTKLSTLKTNLDTAGSEPLVMTSAYDTVNHANACHSNGTCADFDFTNPSYNDSYYTQSELQNINKVVTAANSAGMKAEWEVNTQNEKDNLLAASRLAGTNISADNVRVVPTLGSGKSHFSIYCNQQRTASCSQ